MMMVKHFVSGISRKALDFLDNDLNEWVRENKVVLRDIKETYGQAPIGMSGSIESALIISLWYEPANE